MQKNDSKSHDEIAKLIDSTDAQKQQTKTEQPKNVMVSGLREIKENIAFVDKTQNEPIKTDKYDLKQQKTVVGKDKDGKKVTKKVFVTLLNFNHYIQQQAWPSSIYFVDKLLRLNTDASLEWMSRYLKKKRSMNKDFIWLMIFIVIIIIAIAVLWMFLSRGGV